MNKDKLEFYRSILLERQKYILKNIERLRELSQVKDMENDFNERYSFHLADQGSDALGKEESFMLLSRELRYLNQIEQALNSIDRGIYGICNICGREIPDERLEAVPTTNSCINCKTKYVKKFHLN